MKLTEADIYKRYRIRYRHRNQRRDRVMVAQYLGFNRLHHEHDFNLRPLAGTTSIPDEDIISVEETDAKIKRPVMA